jgi:hypothetical protein
MQAVATKEEAAELRALVRAGRLFDVQAWLEARKPFRTNRFLSVPLFIQFEPCVAAVQTGFFSMVECFLRCKLLKRELNAMLLVAVQKHRPDLVELLFNKGGKVDAVPLLLLNRTLAMTQHAILKTHQNRLWRVFPRRSLSLPCPDTAACHLRQPVRRVWPLCLALWPIS